MNKNNVLILVSFLFSSLAFAVPHRWAAEVSRLAAEEVNAFQGETVEFYPEITAYSEPFVSDTYQLYYQTNGMGGLYFSGAITTNLPVLFTPAMDVGATSYSFFIGTTNSAGLCFRPHGTLRMKKSPGFRPNTIPLPVTRIDFATTAYTNAPWLTSSAWLSWLSTNNFLRVETDAIALASVAVHETNQTAHASLLSKFLTNETDVVSLRAYHYGSSDVHESPASWFAFNPDWQTITEYVNPANGADVVIPWAINGVEVKWIGSSSFKDAVINSVIAPKTLTSLDPSSFKNCSFKTAVFPAVTYIDEGSFNNCPFLNSITWGSDAPDVEELEYLFEDSNSVTNYVNSLTAVGWGDMFGDRPVIRIGIATGSLTLGGVTKSAWPAASSGVPAVWTNMVWGSVGTNTLYQMSWDATNGTWMVREILP